MWDDGARAVKLVIGFYQGARQLHQEGNRVDVVAFIHKSYSPFEFTDVILHRMHTMIGVASNFTILFALEPLLDDDGAMGDTSPHILDGRAQGQDDPLAPQGFQVPGQCPLTAVKQSIRQVFHSQQSSLLEGLDTDALHPMSAQWRNSLGPSNLQILLTGIQRQGDGQLFALRQRCV